MEEENQLQHIAEIRSLMERSKRFISLSGLSGVSAGLIAIAGALFAFIYLDFDKQFFDFNHFYNEGLNFQFDNKSVLVLCLDALFVLLFALLSAFYFSYKKAKKNNLIFWESSTKRLVTNLFIPLVTGGAMCIILLYYQLIVFIAPVTLIFYGLALVNGSNFTLNEIRYLGILEIILGLISLLIPGYGLIFWTIGFGLLHVIYGSYMYFKYDR